MNKERIFRGAKIAYFFVFLVTPATFLMRIFFSRVLSVEEYGLFFAFLGLLGFASLILTFGLNESLTHYGPKLMKECKYGLLKKSFLQVLAFQILMAAFFSVLLLIFREALATEFFHTYKALAVFPVFILFIIAKMFFDMTVSFFKGMNDEMAYSSANPLRLFVVLIGSVIAYFLYPERVFYAISIVWALSFLVFVPYLIGAASKYKTVFAAKIPRASSFTSLFRYGSFLVLSGGAAFVFSQTDVVMITFFKGVEATGFYQVALPLATLVLLFVQPLLSFLFPMISHLHHSKNRKMVNYVLGASYNLGVYVLMPISVVVYAFATQLVELIFGIEYLPAITATKILSVAFLLKGLASLNFTILDGIGQVRQKTVLFYWGAALNVILNLMLIPLIGIDGAALATAISFFFMLVWSIILIRSKNYSIRLSNWPKIIFCNVLILSEIIILKRVLFLQIYVEPFVILSIAGLTYLALGYLLNIVDFSELKKLLLARKKVI